MLADGRSQAASKSLDQANERFTNQTNEIAKLRLDFFDRLVLLDGGTISLSLTLVGLLQKFAVPSLRWRWTLFASWTCFTLSLILAMLRNWKEHDRLLATAFATYALVVHEWFSAFAQQVQTLGVSTANSLARQALARGPEVVTDQQKQSDSLTRTATRIGAAAVGLTVVGYLLLLAFAIRNIAVWLRP